MKRVMISGVSGYIGSFLAASLSTEYTVYGIGRKNSRINSPGVNPAYGVSACFSWDDLASLPEVDVVIHLAGLAHDLKNITPESAYYEANVGLTSKLFQWFLTSGASRFIFFSSVKAVVDTLGADELLTEQTPAAPKTHYGKSKLSAEQSIQSAMDSYRNAMGDKCKKSLVILRPAMVVGPGNKGNLDLMIRFVKTGLPWPLGAFRNERSVASLQNIAFVTEKLIQKENVSGVYNLCDDGYVSTNELYTLLCQGAGRRPLIWHFPRLLIRLIACVGDYISLPLNTNRLEKLSGSFRVSNELIKSVLGVNHMEVSTDKSIRASINP